MSSWLGSVSRVFHFISFSKGTFSNLAIIICFGLLFSLGQSAPATGAEVVSAGSPENTKKLSKYQRVAQSPFFGSSHDINSGSEVSSESSISNWNNTPSYVTGPKNYKYQSNYNSNFDSYYFNDKRKRTPKIYSSTYRAMCVRLKDGYYWPLHFATTKDKFEEAELQCQQSCAADVKLYYYRNPGEDIADMRDLEGNQYASLETAFLYRTKYIPSAQCKPQPWTQEAKAVHAKFAAEEKELRQKLALEALKKAEAKRLAALERAKRKSRNWRRGRASRYRYKKRRYRRARKYRRKKYYSYSYSSY